MGTGNRILLKVLGPGWNALKNVAEKRKEVIFFKKEAYPKLMKGQEDNCV